MPKRKIRRKSYADLILRKDTEELSMLKRDILNQLRARYKYKATDFSELNDRLIILNNELRRRKALEYTVEDDGKLLDLYKSKKKRRHTKKAKVKKKSAWVVIWRGGAPQ